MAKTIEAYSPHAAWETMSMRMAATVFLYGLVVGLITYVLYLLFERFIFDPILCRESVALVRCESVSTLSAGMAIIIGSFVGLVFLVRERVYRPILAIIGVAISLWGIFILLSTLPIVLAMIIGSLLFALAYVLFSWLVQPTSLVVSIVGVVIVALLARLALS